MSGTAIVAIPSQDDYVWKISSEKVPHMTLLFLGDQSANPNLEDIVQFVRHVVKTSMRPFGVTVDHRGELGPDKADVLFFSDDYRQLDMVKQARDFMLTDAHILEAYNSTEQFDKWTPHLTLGYPETPAHPDNRNYPGISWINFDRIAVWTGDYAGPDFQLEDNHTNLEVSMSDIVDKVLAHHGVKGMKWGVRNDRGHVGERAKTKTINKLDKKFEKEINTANAGRANPALHNAVVSRLNARVQELNDSPKYRDMDNASPKLRAQYEKDSHDLIMRSFEDGVREVYGSNASGTKKGVYNRATDKIDIVDKVAKHAADGSVPDFTVKLKRDDSGKIVSVELVELDAKGNELAHYGVKGMHWGVRKDDSTRQRLGLQSRSATKPKPSEDKASANASAAKVKRGNTDSLSNKELQQLVNRMNLEQQYSRLSSQSGTVKRGQQGVKDVLAVGKTANEAAQFAQSPIGKAIGRGIKAAALSAAAAAGKMAAKRALKRS